MDDQIEVIGDDDGIALIGNSSAVERLLGERGLLGSSRALDLRKLGAATQVVSTVLDGAAEAAAKSGRWIKLTEESAALVKEFGLQETKTPGIRHVMIGVPGETKKWVQAEVGGAGSLLSNPAVVAGAAGILAQMARQQEMREIQEYLANIDKKVSDVLRAQKDAELGKLFGARLSIERAISVREEQGGRTDPTTWTTVQDRVGGVDDLLSWALLGLKRIAEKVDAASSSRERARVATSARAEADELLAVVAHCFELQDALDVLRLDRVLEESPQDLDAQRTALERHRQERRSSVQEATDLLVSRLDDAAERANSHLILHPMAAKAVTDSANQIGNSIRALRAPLGIDSSHSELVAPRWRSALVQPDQLASAGKEAGPYLVLPGLAIGGVVLYAIPVTRPYATKALEVAGKIIRPGA